MAVNGTRTTSPVGRARQATIDMRGRPAQLVKVVITATTTAGRTVRTTRPYQTCVKHRAGPPLPTLRLR